MSSKNNDLFNPDLDNFNDKNKNQIKGLTNTPKLLIFGALSVLLVMLLFVVLTAGNKKDNKEEANGLSVAKNTGAYNTDDEFVKNLARNKKNRVEESEQEEIEDFRTVISNIDTPVSSREEVPKIDNSTSEITTLGFTTSVPIPVSVINENIAVYDRDDTYSSVHLTINEITSFRQRRLSDIEEALKSPLNVYKGGQHTQVASASNVSQPSSTSAGEDYTQMKSFDEEYAKAMARVNPSPAPISSSTPYQSGNYPIQNTSSATGGDKWTLKSQLDKPNPYTIKTGAIIPATLITEINSTIQGLITGQVRNDVYDTATGRHLLIPQGTRLVGTYATEVPYGQSRLYIAWNRLIFPNGSSLDIDMMPGADMTGKGGFEDEVNNHYLRIFGNALLLSLIIAGVNMSQQELLNNYIPRYLESSTTALSQSLGQSLGETMSQIIRKNLNIAPEITIRAGYLFNIMVVKDITLPVYK